PTRRTSDLMSMPVTKNHAAVDKPWLNMSSADPTAATLEKMNTPKMMKPKCETDTNAISRRMSSWPTASNAPYRMEMTARTTTTGLAHSDAPGKSPRQKRIIPKVPILSITLTSSTDVAGVPAAVASGSQVCSGQSGALTAKAMKKPQNK